jgi:hypothetical protein
VNVENYNDCLAELQGKQRQISLFLGNGFSMAYDAKIFSYNALQTFIAELSDPVINHLFNVVKSRNLEVIMQQLHVLSDLLDVFGDYDDLKGKVAAADTSLRKGLIDAVQRLHPEHVFAVPEEQIAACYKFLEPYLADSGSIFTSNYDLLLYWVLMRSGCRAHNDGFGYELENPEEEDPEEHVWSDVLTWGPNVGGQNLHYVHGALHLFDTGIDIEKEMYDNARYLLQNIEDRMLREEYPVFVTAGDGNDKLAQIMHNRYLAHCYSKLCEVKGSLVTFGFNFGAYDEHIIEAINIAAHHGRRSGDKLFSIYVGVYDDEAAEHIKSIAGKFRCKVRIFDSKTAQVWENET